MAIGGLVLGLFAPAQATSADRGLAERLNVVFKRSALAAGNPGAQAVVMRNGRLVWSARRGIARQPRSGVREDTLFALGSFGKLMLASFALRKVEAGRLALDEPIARYVGDSVAGSQVVTSRMLLTHTAGYPDVYSAPETGPLFGDRYDPNRRWTFGTLSAGIHDPVSLGAKWEYSNTGYIVLARVLGAITKRPLERAFSAFVRSAGSPRPRDRRALTMRRSRRAFRRIAHGYSVRAGVVQDNFEGADRIPTDLYGLPFGDGAFAGTALGAAEFLDALLVRGRLLRSPTVRRMLKRTPQSKAAGTSYGMGVEREVVAGRRWRGHLGSYAGFSTLGSTDRKRGVSLVVVANREVEGQQLPAQTIWRALARAYTRATS